MPVDKLVYIAPLKWSSYSQRPHYMMRYLADRYDIEIFWIDPYPVRLPRMTDFLRRRDVYNQGTSMHPGIRVLSHHSVPIEPLVNCGATYRWLFLRSQIRQVMRFSGNSEVALGIGKPCCLAKHLLVSVGFQRSFYDAMDDYAEFHGGISRKYVANMEKTITHNVDEVFASSTYLEARLRKINQNTILLPNGYDANALNNSSNSLPENPSGNVLGYVGTIYHWFDWDLVVRIASDFPESTIRLIGPVLGRVPGDLPKNIEILPACSNDRAQMYMREFDIGLIPFIDNTATRAVDPIKYYEYRAIGLPVISTEFGDMPRKIDDPGLFLVDVHDADRITNAVSSALIYDRKNDKFELKEEASWISRFENAAILDDCLAVR